MLRFATLITSYPRCAAAVYVLFAARLAVFGQSYIVSTVAGGAAPPTPVQAVHASFGPAQSVVADTSQNVYFTSDSCVFKVDAQGILTRIAGTGRPGYSGDGGPASAAQLDRYLGLAIDKVGNLYLAESGNAHVRMIAPDGKIKTIAGSDTARQLGDGGPATAAQLSAPEGVAVDGAGNVYIADSSANRIRKVSPAGIITTVAGTGSAGYSGDGGPATAALLHAPISVAVDATGTIYIADSFNNALRKVAAEPALSRPCSPAENPSLRAAARCWLV